MIVWRTLTKRRIISQETVEHYLKNGGSIEYFGPEIERTPKEIEAIETLLSTKSQIPDRKKAYRILKGDPILNRPDKAPIDKMIEVKQHLIGKLSYQLIEFFQQKPWMPRRGCYRKFINHMQMHNHKTVSGIRLLDSGLDFYELNRITFRYKKKAKELLL